MDSLFTADITRTFPTNGRFTPAQRKIYPLVYEAQKAGMKAVKSGAKFRDFHVAASEVLARGLEEMGVLPIPAQESLKPDCRKFLHSRMKRCQRQVLVLEQIGSLGLSPSR